MLRRYIFRGARAEIQVVLGGDPFVCEIWLGIEIESVQPVDLAAFSRDHGYDLIPADGMTAAELASVGVKRFEPWDGE